MKILGTGLSGLVGSRIVELLSDKHEFENLSTSTGVNILDKNNVFEKISNSDAKFVIHLAAKTNVDGCEGDKEKDIKAFLENNEEIQKEQIKNKSAWAVNVLGTKNIVDACLKTNKNLLYISTDFVFSGNDCPDTGYSEEDKPDPINWYSKTKYEGEKIIQNSNLRWTIIRIAYPYRANFVKTDFVRSLIKAFNDKRTLNLITDHVMCPAFIDDIAFGIDALIEKEEKGIFHMVGGQKISPYEAGLLIARVFNFDVDLVNKTTRENYFKGGAKRPFQLFLKNGKIEKLGIKMRRLEESLMEIKKQRTNY